LEDIHLDECVNCGAGLLAVSDICPQCGFLKSKGDELIEAREKAANENDLDESEEKSNNIVIDNYEEFVEKVANEISNPSPKKPTVIKNKIFRPSGVRLFGIFHMLFGISIVSFGIVFGSAVIFLVMSSGMGSLGDIGGGMGNMMMLPGMGGIDASTMSSIDTIIGLNAIAGSPSASDIEVRMNSSGILDIDLMMEIITETSVIALIEIAIGVSVFVVGIGLFKGKKWARPVTIGYSIISIPLVVLFVENINNLILLGMAAFDGILLYYMFKSKVKEYFAQPTIKKPNKKSKIKNSKTVKKS
jgi:hypothetical protein